jgi:hypothetical protein
MTSILPEFSDISLREPVTVFINVLICFLCFYFGIKLLQNKINNWSGFFFIIAMAFLAGAIGHGFYIDKNNVFQLIARMLGVASVYFPLSDGIRHFSQKNMKLTLQTVAIIEVMIFMMLLINENDIKYVTYNSVISFGIILPGMHLKFLSEKIAGSSYIIAGILVHCMAGFIFTFKISPFWWCNQNDFSHLIMIVGFCLFFKGAKQKTLHQELRATR